MQTANGEMYKDCTPQDFDHYFRGTAMVLKLPTDKKRLYVVEGIGGNGAIMGSYLTRERVWKEKQIMMRGWWDQLDVVLPHALHFNVGNVAGTWVPSLSRNLKKSFPYMTNYVCLYGDPTPEEASEQFVSAVAFGDFYSNTKLPDANYALRSDRSATATEGHFVFDKHSKTVFFKHKVKIGKIVPLRSGHGVELEHRRSIFRDLLINDAGLRYDQVIVLDPSKTVEPAPAPLPYQEHQLQQATAAWEQTFNPLQQPVNAPQFGIGGGATTLGAGVNMNQGWFTGTAQTQAGLWAATPPHPPMPAPIEWNWGGVTNHVTAAIPGNPNGATPFSMRSEVYDQPPVGTLTWVRPTWGRGYATRNWDGTVLTFRGTPPTQLPHGQRPFSRWGQS